MQPGTGLRKRYPRFVRRAPQSRAAVSTGFKAPGYTSVLMSPSVAGPMVTPHVALTFSAAYAAIKVLSEDTSSLPIEIFQRVKRAGRTSRLSVTGHPLVEILTVSPDGETTDLQWREAWMAHCLGWGSGYGEIESSKGGDILALHLLHPSTTKSDRNKSGDLVYRLSDTGDTLPARKVLHLAGLSFNGIDGYSPIGLHREAIGLGLAAQDFGASLFGNGAIPRGILTYPGILDDIAKNNLRESFTRTHGGSRNANKPALLQQGVQWVSTQINPDDAQFLATRQFQVVEIARIFRLPPHKIGDFTQSHLANVEASNLDYLITTLRPWLVRIEKLMNFRLLSKEERAAGFYVRHDMRALLRGDAKTRAEYYTKLRDLGALTIDDILDFEDMNPIGDEAGGETRFVTVNVQPLANAAKALASPNSKPPTTPAAPPAVDGVEPLDNEDEADDVDA